MLRMRQLELISVLADAGNMRAAAQRLNISTAAVSKGLLELEALFDVEIFLTPAARRRSDVGRHTDHTARASC